MTGTFRVRSWLLLSACALAGAGCRDAQTPAAAVVAFRPAVEPVSAAPAATAQWPGWRGGGLHGVSPAARLPTVWSEQQGVRWKVATPGRGNSSPIVWGERLFLTSIVPTESGEQAALLCYDCATGDEVWRQIVAPPQGPAHNKNGHASSTPATDGERVYAAFGALGIAAFDIETGELAWRVPLPKLIHQWGMASSPLVHERLVVHVADGESGGELIALDAATGHEQWRTPRASQGAWSSPIAVQAGTGATASWEIVVNGTGSSGSAGETIAYDPKSGAELWKVRGTTDIPCPTAIAGNGLVVSTSGSNGPVFAIRPGGRGDVTESHRAWHLPSGGPYVPTGIIYQDRLLLISDSGMLACHSLSDGAQVWKKRLQGSFSASLVAGGGHVYAVSERGDISVFTPREHFELIATNRLLEPCVATPAIAHGELFVRSERHLYCISETELAAAEPADMPPAVEAASTPSPADANVLVSP